MTPEAAEQDYLAELASRPAARAPASFSEIVAAEWAASGLDTLAGSSAPREDAYEDLLGKAEAATGKTLRMSPLVPVEQRVDHIRFMIAELDADKKQALEPLLDVRGNAAKKAQAIEREAAETRAATFGITGNGLAFLTGMARQVVDPVNLMTVPLGGPLKGPLIKMLGREFLLNATIQAAQEPVIQQNRAALGLSSGVGEAAANTFEAGLGAAALSGLLRAAGAGLRAMRRQPPAPPETLLADWDGARTFTGYLEADDAAALDRGRTFTPLRPAAVGEAGDLPPVADFDFAAGVGVRPTAERLPDRPPVPDRERLGYLDADDAAALDRGRTFTAPGPAAIGEASTPIPGLAGGLNFVEGARARVTAEKRPERPPGAPSAEPLGYLTPAAADALDRGATFLHRTEAEAFGALGDGPDFAWRFDLDPEDFEAAARAAETEAAVFAQLPSDPQARLLVGQRIADVAQTMESGAPAGRAVDPPPLNAPRPRRGHAARDEKTFSLLEFLASRGGLRADDPNIADVLAAFGGVNPFVPGFGRLIRKDGMPLDRAREAAAEAQYAGLDPFRAGDKGGRSTVRHLLDAMADEERGNKVYREDFAPEPKRDLAREREELAVHRERIAADFDADMAQLQITKFRPGARKRALQIMEREGVKKPIDALERALIEFEERDEVKRRARQSQVVDDIPGWDVPDDAGAAPQMGEGAARAIRERPGDAGPGGTARAAGERDGARGGDEGDGAQSAGIGDPALAADAQRILDDNPDLDISIPDADGTIRKVKASEAIREAEEQARAADELKKCVGGAKPASGPRAGGSDPDNGEVPF